MYQPRFRSPLCIFAAAALLTACGGAPSDGEIKSALTNQFDQERAQMSRIAGPAAAMLQGLRPEVTDVKKIGCKEDGEKAYRCDVEVHLKQGDTTQTTPTSLRFVKTSEGWVPSR